MKETSEFPPGLVEDVTEAQDNAGKALYHAAVADQAPSDEVLAQMVHTLCDSLLRANTSLEKVFGPVEFAFSLFLKNKEGRYRSIGHLTAFFAAMQWCLRIILTHVIRLHFHGLPSYIPCNYSVALLPPATPSTSNPLLIEMANQDELEACLDSPGDLDNPVGDDTPESFGDTEEAMDQETTASGPDDLTLVKDRILPQNSEGLLK